MNRSFGFALIGATVAATLVALFPIARYLGKIGAWDLAADLFVSEVILRIALGVVLLAGALLLHARSSRLGWVLLVASPFLVFGADLLLMALPG